MPRDGFAAQSQFGRTERNIELIMPHSIRKPTVFSWAGTGGVTADSDLVFYADESGNTGSNHLDAAQPYYVTAGWLMQRTDAAKANSLVRRTLSETSMTELKGTQMMKTTLGRNAVLKLVPSLMAFCTPVMVAIEKTFALGARLLEDFVFYPGGPFFPHRPARAQAREMIAVLSSLPSSVLSAANRYVSDPSPETARICSTALGQALSEVNEEKLAKYTHEAAVAPTAWWNRSDILVRSLSPNVMAYNTLLQMLEILGLECNQSITLVHDELKSLQHVYEFYSDYAAQADLRLSSEFFEQIGIPGRVAHVRPPEFPSSKSELMIQAADVLCAVGTTFMTQLERSPQNFSSEYRELAVLVLWGFVEPDLHRYFTYIGSHDSGFRFGQTLVDFSAEFFKSE